MSSHPAGTASLPGISPRVISDTDGYTSSVAGVTVEGVRAGKGIGPNVVLGIPGERYTVTSSRIGFPMLTRSHIAEGKIVATFIHQTSGGSRWCGVRLRPGTVMVYGPGAEHLAVNLPGLRFTFAITDLEQLNGAANEIDIPIRMPPHGGVMEFRVSAATRALGHSLDARTSSAVGGKALSTDVDNVLSSFANLLRSESTSQFTGRGKGIDSRQIVHACVEFATATDRIPSIGELCLAAHVSERRLREAFVDEFDQPPSQYFRLWALSEAHRRLRTADLAECTVTAVAARLGFGHLGRFAGYYKNVYGQSPSETLGSPDRCVS